MKTSLLHSIALLIVATLPVGAQSTAFTYQGLLSESTNRAHGTYELRFAIYDIAASGAPLAGPVTSAPVTVSNGLFTVTLDFGASAFGGGERWLEIGVRTNGSASAFIALTPRQRLTATPYAVTAANLSGALMNTSLAGTYGSALTLNNPANQFTGTFSGNGAGLGNVAALTLGGLSASGFWQLGGNAGSTAGTHFLGTTDNQSLELKVNGVRALRLEPTASNDTVNLVGGSPHNFVALGVIGATIAGGAAGAVLDANSVSSDFGTIGGGIRNVIAVQSAHSIISGGLANGIGTNSPSSNIGGGTNNSIGRLASFSTIGGGRDNTIELFGGGSAIGGGRENIVRRESGWSTIPGGYRNDIGMSSDASTIGGGQFNQIADDSPFSTIAGGAVNAIGAQAAVSFIGGGGQNIIGANSTNSTIVAGNDNAIGTNSAYAVIPGGDHNTIGANSSFAIIPGGDRNFATNRAFAAGRRAKAIHSGAFLWADSQNADFFSTSNNQFAVRAGGGLRFETAGGGATLDGEAILTGPIGANEIADGSINMSKLTANSVAAAQIVNGSITSADLGPNSVTTPALADGSVNMSKLTANSVASAQLVNGSVSAVDVNAASFSNMFWKADGNAGTTAGAHFLGTTDNQPLEIRVNSLPALRIEPALIPNFVHGSSSAVIPGRIGGTIGGGDGQTVDADHGTIAGGRSNTVHNINGTVGGGIFNAAGGGPSATVGGGHANTAGGHFTTVSGGRFNTAIGFVSGVGGGQGNVVETNADHSMIGGGLNNLIESFSFRGVIAGGGGNRIGLDSDYGTISGGQENHVTNNALYATIAGGLQNTAGGHYTTVGGGRFNTAMAFVSGVGGGQGNIIETNADHSVIGGGLNNLIEATSFRGVIAGGGGNHIGFDTDYATISGGQENHITNLAHYATIGGGYENDVEWGGWYSVIGGGLENTISAAAFASVIGGGFSNVIQLNAAYATVPGGFLNSATNFSLAAGTQAKANHPGAFVWADAQGIDFPSTAANQFSVRAFGGVRLEVGGAGATLNGEPILAGQVGASEIANGSINISKLTANSVASGQLVNGSVSALDVNAASFATTFWKTDGNAGTTPGTHFLGTTDNQALEIRVNSAPALRIEPGTVPNIIHGSSNTVLAGRVGATIGGGGNHIIDADQATIAGGRSNVVNNVSGTVGGGIFNSAGGGPAATVAGGHANTAGGQFTTVGGGRFNTAIGFVSGVGGGQGNIVETNADHSVIGGGLNNLVESFSFRAVIAGGGGNDIGLDADYATISGGQENHITNTAHYATIAGGFENDIGMNSTYSSIGGGNNNAVAPNSSYAAIPGGDNNFATNRAFAAGTRARANHSGAFVWADSTLADVASTNANSVTMRAAGGYRLFSSSLLVTTNGVVLAANGGSWTSMSDRNAKENFEPVDARAVLNKVTSLSLSTWNYKSQPEEIRHIGPMAQDFKAAFGVGESDTGITTIDADGVALAAIQGLHQIMHEKDARITALEKSVAELTALVNRLAPHQPSRAAAP